MASIDLSATMSAYPYSGPGDNVESYTESMLSTVIDIGQALQEAADEIAKELEDIGGSVNIVPGSAVGDEWVRLAIKAPDVQSILDGVEKVVGALNAVNKILTPALKLLELFLSATGSWAKALVSVINALQAELNKYITVTAGMYINLLVPPSFMKIGQDVTALANLSSGGFDGFISRLKTSAKDPNDENRPPFDNPLDVVGGFVILVDSETLDKVYASLEQLSSFFNVFEPFGITLSPPPPRNIRGYSGYFTVGNETKFGIKLEWDRPTSPAISFRVSRSSISGGELTEVADIPKKLGGKDGLIATIAKMFRTKSFKWPTITKAVYNDFSATVIRNSKGGGEYYDFDIPGEEKEMDTVIGGVPGKFKYIYPDNLYYYYVIESMFLDNTVGEPSTEKKIVVKNCDDTEATANVVEHSDGSFEYLSLDGALIENRWQSAEVNAFIPYLPQLIDKLNDMLNSFKGGTNDASDAFSDLIRDIQAKINDYITIVAILQKLITQLSKFIIGPSVAWLWVPPEEGGMLNFINRIEDAKLPEGQESFSGPNGTSIGLVGVFGYESLKASPALKAQINVLSKTWEAMISLIT